MKNDELYASSSLEMLKAFQEKTELRYNRKNLGLIEKIKALLEAFYQVYKPDPLNLIDPFRYQRTETRFSLPHHFSCQIKDAARRIINAMSKIFKGGFDTRKDFLKPAMQPACDPVSRSIKQLENIHHINKIRLCSKPKLSFFNHEEDEGHEKGF